MFHHRSPSQPRLSHIPFLYHFRWYLFGDVNKGYSFSVRLAKTEHSWASNLATVLSLLTLISVKCPCSTRRNVISIIWKALDSFRLLSRIPNHNIMREHTSFYKIWSMYCYETSSFMFLKLCHRLIEICLSKEHILKNTSLNKICVYACARTHALSLLKCIKLWLSTGKTLYVSS